MFYEMRRKDRLLTEKEAREILSEGEYGVLSTMGENGYPYGVPVNYVYLNDNIYFHCAADVGHKLENIKYNNHVCFTVVTNASVLPEALTTKYISVIAFGAAQCIKGEEKQSALVAVINKFSPDFIQNGMSYIEKNFEAVDIYKINIEHVSGKSNR